MLLGSRRCHQTLQVLEREVEDPVVGRDLNLLVMIMTVMEFYGCGLSNPNGGLLVVIMSIQQLKEELRLYHPKQNFLNIVLQSIPLCNQEYFVFYL